MVQPILHLVRHAQGYHNLTPDNHKLPDPDLTPLGEAQCETLCANFPYHSKITHLVASPIRRTIYTCILSFKPEVASGKIVLCIPELQETTDNPCDTGSEPEKIKAEFGDKVDLHLVQKGWNGKTGKWAPIPEAIAERARQARVFLREYARQAGEDAQIVIVTHGGLLHYFTQDWDGHDKYNGTGWANTEWRSYQFADLESDDSEASLVELEESKTRRQEIPLTEAERTQLKMTGVEVPEQKL